MLSDSCLGSVEADVSGDVAYGVEDVADSAAGGANVVEVFAVPPRAVEPKFVEARAASEDEFFAE